MPSLGSVFALISLRRALVASPTATADSSQFHPTSGLNVASRDARKLYLGTATNSDEWNDMTYFDILRNDAVFGQVTPANVMKWFATEPTEGVFTFEDADVIANFTRPGSCSVTTTACVDRYKGHVCTDATGIAQKKKDTRR
ncbi:hypothetical protein BD413DRAFT_611895 [Trametes elegans]|nr:hypothetical protein BD413DRAFT_611895 [Trametes elegans]